MCTLNEILIESLKEKINISEQASLKVPSINSLKVLNDREKRIKDLLGKQKSSKGSSSKFDVTKIRDWRNRNQNIRGQELLARYKAL